MRIEAQSLVKAYKKRRVVNGVSFAFEQGQVVGLLGPNGAGKTTTFYMITGLIRPTEGNVAFDGQVVTKDVEVDAPPQVEVLFDLMNYPIGKVADGGNGQHIHLIVDNEPYLAVYDATRFVVGLGGHQGLQS